MSDINKSLMLEYTKIPELNDPNYGKHIKDKFINIDDNFKKLVSLDYFKGDKGDPVLLEEKDLSNPTNLYLVNNIKNAILQHFGQSGLKSITDKHGSTINWDDNFKNSPGKIVLMVSGGEVISSLAYTYLDPRFGKNLNDYAKIPLNHYETLTDASCVVVFDNNINKSPMFKVLESFPTIYFDDDSQTFCWKIWGNRTGLPISGGCSNTDSINLLKYFVVKDNINIVKI